MIRFRSSHQEDTTYRVLRLLQANPDITQRELAEALGVSTSGVNYCLKALAQKAALTGRFLKRKMAEYDALKVEIEALSAELEVSST